MIRIAKLPKCILPMAACAMGLALSLAAQAEDGMEKVKRQGELVVGSEFQFAPFDFTENGVHKGVNVDVMDQVGKALGIKIKYVDLPWSSVLPGLETGKYDLVTGPVTVTKERMGHYRFTVPIADASVAFLKRTSDKNLNKPEDVSGKIIGSQKGSSQLAQTKVYTDGLPAKVEMRAYVDFNQAYADLAAGRIVAVANSLPNIAYVASQRPEVFSVVQPTVGAKTYFAFLGRKDADSKALIDAIDAQIVAMEKDGRMAVIQKKWFGAPMQIPMQPIDNPGV